MIIGISGIGKTTAIRVASALFQPALHHTDLQNESIVQVPIVRIECPKDGSIKDLCAHFFIELDKVLGTRYEFEFCKNRDTASDRVIAMSKLVSAHCIGIIIVDEIQHLSSAKSGGSEMMLNFFLNLDNTLHIPIIIVGTPEALELFSEKQRFRRRFTAGDGLMWDRLPEDIEWTTTIKQLFKYQYTEKEADKDVNWSSIFYYHTQGIIDRAIKLFIKAQNIAFLLKEESITIDIINGAANEMWIDQSVIKKLREGKLANEQYSDLLLPKNTSDFKSNYRLSSIQNILDDHDVPINFSSPLIEENVKSNPSLSDAEISLRILKEFKLSKLSLNSKKAKVNLTKNYVHNDLRNCTTNDSSTLYHQLKERNIIANLGKYMIG